MSNKTNNRQVRSFRKLLYEILIKNDSYYRNTRVTFLEQCMEVNMNKVVIKILQASVVTQSVLGGLTIYLPIINVLRCVCAKIMKLG